MSVHFLTGCHATPYYSALHADVPMWFPDCSPRARLSAAGTAAASLARDPRAFARALYAGALVAKPAAQQRSGAGGAAVAAAAAAAPAPAAGQPVLFAVQPLPLPTHIVMFDASEPELRAVIAPLGFRRVASFFHAHFGDDPGHMLVFKRGAAS